MPALNFQAQFADAVERGEKCQTIRAYRKDKRDPKTGDTLYLYTGMRTKSCRKIGEVECLGSAEIRIGKGLLWVSDPRIKTNNPMNTFAKLDGFDNWDAMEAWFEETHGLPFEGLLIRWEPSVRASHVMGS